MSEQFSVDEVRDLPSVQFRSAGTVYDPNPDPTALLVLPDNSTSALTLTKQGTGTTTRWLVEDFTRAVAGQYEVRYITTDTAADIAEWVEYISVRVPEAVDLAPVLAQLDDIEAAIAGITAGSVSVISPVDAATANVTVIQGDTYAATESRLLQWTSDGWSAYDLSTATNIQFRARSRYSITVFTKNAVAPYADTLVQVALTSAETADFPTGQSAMDYDLQATLLTGSIVTLALGKVNVTKDVN